MNVKITWNNSAGPIDSILINATDDDRLITDALIHLVKNSIVSVGDTFIVEAV